MENNNSKKIGCNLSGETPLSIGDRCEGCIYRNYPETCDEFIQFSGLKVIYGADK